MVPIATIDLIRHHPPRLSRGVVPFGCSRSEGQASMVNSSSGRGMQAALWATSMRVSLTSPVPWRR